MEIDRAVVLVAGGASGLGEAAARLLAELGATVVVVDRDAERGPEVAAAVGGRFEPADVGDEATVDRAVEAASAAGPLRAVVNCAGIGWADRVLRPDGSRHPTSGFEKVLRVNLVGTFNVLRAAGAAMAGLDPDSDGQRGVIVNTASVAAYDGQAGQAAYAASKGGVVALTLPAARDLAALGVRVCTIVPGLMDTPLADTMPSHTRARLEAQALFPRRFGRPEEFARLAAQIIENPYVNGECIRLDAGLRLPPK
jgi:NAD(P)-dependent dehydrogenase (short-subunit alcohol dehydrogenase family)